MVNKIVALYPIGNAVCEIADSDVGGWTAQTVTIYVRKGADWKAIMTYVNNAMPTEPPKQQTNTPDPKLHHLLLDRLMPVERFLTKLDTLLKGGQSMRTVNSLDWPLLLFTVIVSPR
jgi:hypothetical protein